MDEKKELIKQAAQLVALGYEVEYRRDKVRRIAELGMEPSIEPSMELFRAMDDFNQADMLYKILEAKHIALREKLMAEE